MTLSKRQIYNSIKTLKKPKDILNAIFLEINKALVRREKVIITHFGTIWVDKSRVKWGHKFQTNERIRLSPKYKVRFKASKVIEKIVNERNLIEG